MSQRVEQDGIRGFWSNSGQVQEPLAQPLRRCRGHLIERALKLGVERCDKCLQGRGFARLKAGRPDQILQIIERYTAQAFYGQCSCATQVGQRQLNALPRCVLSEIGPEYNLEGVRCRPPVLRAVNCRKLIMHTAKSPWCIEEPS